MLADRSYQDWNIDLQAALLLIGASGNLINQHFQPLRDTRTERERERLMHPEYAAALYTCIFVCNQHSAREMLRLLNGVICEGCIAK